MHSYLKSIGFSDLSGRDVRRLLRQVIKSPDSKKLFSQSGGIMHAEYRKMFSDCFGIAVCGEYTEEEGFEYDYYYPFLIPYHVSSVGRIDVEKHLSSYAMSGYCDDYKVGVTLIFYLQNRIDYIRDFGTAWGTSGHHGKQKGYGASLQAGQETSGGMSQVSLSALAGEGMVLLPLKKDNAQARRSIRLNNRRNRLIAQALDGNEEAIEKLAASDMELDTQVMERIAEEDVYTIVDTYFMPYGVECELYSVMGEIADVKNAINSLTNEEIYIINIVCNDLNIEVAINSRDILGEPECGRRFKGTIWLQGVVEPV